MMGGVGRQRGWAGNHEMKGADGGSEVGGMGPAAYGSACTGVGRIVGPAPASRFGCHLIGQPGNGEQTYSNDCLCKSRLKPHWAEAHCLQLLPVTVLVWRSSCSRIPLFSFSASGGGRELYSQAGAQQQQEQGRPAHDVRQAAPASRAMFSPPADQPACLALGCTPVVHTPCRNQQTGRLTPDTTTHPSHLLIAHPLIPQIGRAHV